MVFVEKVPLNIEKKLGYGQLTAFLEDDKCKFRKWKRVLTE